MFRSLRVRLPLLFLAGILLAGLVTTVIAVQLFREFSRDQTLSELRREANGIAELYSNAVNETFGATKRKNARRAPKFARANLETATGDLIGYVGVPPFPGENPGLRQWDIKTIDWSSGETLTFEFIPPGLHHTYLAVARPVKLHKRPIGAIVIAKRKTSVNHSVYLLVERLALAGVLGIVVAALLAWYLSRRLVRPGRGGRGSGIGGALARDRRGGGAAARAARRRHPRPREARRAPLHRHARGGRYGAARRPSVRDLCGAGARTLDRLPRRRPLAAGDRLRRRPRAPDRRQPALERLSRHAGRRPHRARARAGEQHRARGGR